MIWFPDHLPLPAYPSANAVSRARALKTVAQGHASEKADLNIQLSPAEQEKETAWEERQEILDTAKHQDEGAGCWVWRGLRGPSRLLLWKAECLQAAKGTASGFVSVPTSLSQIIQDPRVPSE